MSVVPASRLVTLCVLFAAPVTGVAGQAFPAPPTPTEAQAIRATLTAMKSAERGPYERIRWFCADGTVQPPQAGACRERGGGIQHAEASAAARGLAEVGFHVGTIFAATDYTAFADEERAGYRLRELVLERFLEQVDDGWVMRRARTYRGARQIEDEERAGRALLERRLSDGAWVRANYLLATRLVAAVPHTSLGAEGLMDRIRGAATEIAQLDPDFQPVRVRIHSVPSPADIGLVATHLARAAPGSELRTKLEQLHRDLVAQYDPERALATLAAYEARLDGELGGGIARLRSAVARGNPEAVFTAITDLAPEVRARVEEGRDGARIVDLIDLGLALQERAVALSAELSAAGAGASRSDAIRRLGRYADLAYGAGYLSHREREAFRAEADALIARGTTTAGAYKASLGYLARSIDWAAGTVRGTFTPVLERYALVEPASAQLPDALLRGSVLLPMAAVLDVLQEDADRTLGATHDVLGMPRASGLRGLNPGVALGPFEVLAPGHHEEVDGGTIYLLQETPPELKPVAGVLTGAEGNLLSHVQLLARNLGIPNAAVSADVAARLAEAEGSTLLYAVTPLGRVLVKRADTLTDAERALVAAPEGGSQGRHRLDTSRLRLDARRPVTLADLRTSDSGVLVGPKAANLGQLAADFPGRVSPAVALPFGMFLAHVDRPYGGADRTVIEELRAAYGRAAAMREQGRTEAEIDTYMLERLARVRTAIEALEWLPESRALVVEATTRMLDGDVSRGVFVRSDTNVEDLPEFSGAGLNLTVPHQTSMEQILASIKRVWTSPFSERAYLWRRRILEEQGDVFPSVLLQTTVPSEKSGVLITSGLQEGGPDDLTVVAAEGVGGAVEGEDAETLLLHPDGSSRLLSQAKAPRRREVVTGGTRWVAARRPESLLLPGEIQQLREVVRVWHEKTAGTPEAETTWDIEYGFLDGRLWLFQIRPFIRFRNSDRYRALEALDDEARSNESRPVDLGEAVGGA